MQQPNAGSTGARSAGGALMQAAFGCCILLLYVCPRWSGHCGGFLGALAHLLMCTQMNRHILKLALCGGGCIFMWWWLYVVVVICGGSGCT